VLCSCWVVVVYASSLVPNKLKQLSRLDVIRKAIKFGWTAPRIYSYTLPRVL
jgi:hypothetical protein